MRGALIAAMILVAASAQADVTAIARGIVKVLNKAGVRKADGTMTLVIVYRPDASVLASELRRALEDQNSRDRLLKLQPPILVPVPHDEHYEAAIASALLYSPGTIIALDLWAEAVTALSFQVVGRRILTISNNPDDVKNDKLAVAVTDLTNIATSAVALRLDLLPLIRGFSGESRNLYVRGRFAESESKEEWSKAVDYLSKAIEADPTEEKEYVKLTGGVNYDPFYAPHYFLAVAFANLRKCQEALSQWAISDNQGIVTKWSEEQEKTKSLRTKCQQSVGH
jgi:hypothetical protein